ncbi:hypothetical protein Q3G72_029972 [Acer saccharum]|nr:hypothetical protein Q3G72_029972 [Acer saccharum]
MSYSNLQYLWKDTKDLGNLRRFRLRDYTSYCISLETLPDTTVATGEWDTFDIRYHGPAHLSRFYRKDQSWFSGSEIPKWVRYQKDGSSLTMDLPPHWYINNFFGIVLCIVASCDSSDGDYSFDCTCSFIDSNCDRHENICYWKISNEEATREPITLGRVTTPEHPKSDHVFVKYSGLGEVDSSLSKKDQEEDSQKRIKQRNIVHETRAREWLFSLEEGQWMAVESSKAAYLIMFLLDASHDNISMDDIQKDLSPLVKFLAPGEDNNGIQIPNTFGFSLVPNISKILVTSSLTGPKTVEDVAYENSDPYSHLRN